MGCGGLAKFVLRVLKGVKAAGCLTVTTDGVKDGVVCAYGACVFEPNATSKRKQFLENIHCNEIKSNFYI